MTSELRTTAAGSEDPLPLGPAPPDDAPPFPGRLLPHLTLAVLPSIETPVDHASAARSAV